MSGNCQWHCIEKLRIARPCTASEFGHRTLAPKAPKAPGFTKGGSDSMASGVHDANGPTKRAKEWSLGTFCLEESQGL